MNGEPKFFPAWATLMKQAYEFVEAGSTGSIVFNNKIYFFTGGQSPHY